MCLSRVFDDDDNNLVVVRTIDTKRGSMKILWEMGSCFTICLFTRGFSPFNVWIQVSFSLFRASFDFY